MRKNVFAAALILALGVGEAARSDDEPTDSPTPQGTPPKGTPIGKSGHGRTPTGAICTPIFAPFGDAHSTRLLTVGSSGFALFTYDYSKKPPSGTVVTHSICTRYTAKKSLRRRL